MNIRTELTSHDILDILFKNMGTRKRKKKFLKDPVGFG